MHCNCQNVIHGNEKFNQNIAKQYINFFGAKFQTMCFFFVLFFCCFFCFFFHKLSLGKKFICTVDILTVKQRRSR